MQGSTKKVKEFREWLDDQNYMEEKTERGWHYMGNIGKDCNFQRNNGDNVYIEILEAGAFKTSGTSVRTAIVVITKKFVF